MVRVNGTGDVIQCLRDYQDWREARAGAAPVAREAAQAPVSVP
jgi:hypothetical protein